MLSRRCFVQRRLYGISMNESRERKSPLREYRAGGMQEGEGGVENSVRFDDVQL